MILTCHAQGKRPNVVLGDVDLVVSQLTREFLNRPALHRAEGVAERVRRAAHSLDVRRIAETSQDVFDAAPA